MSKGSKRRPEDPKKIAKGWAGIDWKKPLKPNPEDVENGIIPMDLVYAVNHSKSHKEYMAGKRVDPNNLTCERCDGKAYHRNPSGWGAPQRCDDCNGTGKVSLAVYKAQIGIECDKCGKSDALVYNSSMGRYFCHHTHRI